MSKRGVAKVDGLGEGEMILRDPSGKVLRVVGLQNSNGTVSLYQTAGVVEHDDGDDLDWLTAGPDGRALPLPPERLQ